MIIVNEKDLTDFVERHAKLCGVLGFLLRHFENWEEVYQDATIAAEEMNEGGAFDDDKKFILECVMKGTKEKMQ